MVLPRVEEHMVSEHECVQPCCWPCGHIFLISLFLGAMTSSPVILDPAIVKHSWKDWAWHSPYSFNELSWVSQLVALA